jgi:D-sedoheptulose 7-phosphate isomerase
LFDGDFSLSFFEEESIFFAEKKALTNIQVQIRASLEEGRQVLENFLAQEANLAAIEEAALLLTAALQNGKKILSCGNGGSHCDAMHFAEELSGRYRENRPALAALAISDPSHISCVGNDYGFDFIFSRMVEAIGSEGDVLLGISTSGNSKNILQAVEAARKKGMKVVLLSGKDGGKLAGTADVEIRVPHFGYADRIQEIHIKVIHILIQQIESGLGFTSAAQ